MRNGSALVLDLLSYSDWEEGEATPHGCGVFIIEQA